MHELPRFVYEDAKLVEMMLFLFLSPISTSRNFEPDSDPVRGGGLRGLLGGEGVTLAILSNVKIYTNLLNL